MPTGLRLKLCDFCEVLCKQIVYKQLTVCLCISSRLLKILTLVLWVMCPLLICHWCMGFADQYSVSISAKLDSNWN